MSSVSIPRSINAAERKLNSLGELATATEWERAAIVAAFVQPRVGQGKRTSAETSGSLESPTEFAKRGIHGLTNHTTVKLYHDAWFNIYDEDGEVIGQRERPAPGRSVKLPDDPWPPTRTGTDGYNSEDGAAKTIEKIVEKHGAAALASATKASPKVAEAAAQALVEKGDVGALANATAKASKNRQVERNRQRASAGESKSRSVQDPKPTPFEPDVAAFLSVQGLSTALRALVTTFPEEWEALSEEAKSEEFVAVCEETLDKIQIALANCRNIVTGGVQDKAILRLLEGGVA